MNVRNRHIQRQKVGYWLCRAGGLLEEQGKGKGLISKRYGASFRGDENVPMSVKELVHISIRETPLTMVVGVGIVAQWVKLPLITPASHIGVRV